MDQLKKFLKITHPTLEDAPKVLELMSTCEIQEYGESDSDMEDLLYDWKRIDLDTDAWLAFGSDGYLVGYSAVIPWGMNWNLDFYLHPDHADEHRSKALLKLGMDRLMEIGKGVQNSIKALTYVAAVNQQDRLLFESAGFSVNRHHFQMQIDLKEMPQTPDWPDGLKIQTFEQGCRSDLVEIHMLIQEAFDKPGRTPQSFEDWCKTMTREDIFEPELWFLVRSAGRIVGVCLCYNYPGSGWVRQLGVVEDWRRKGLGSALLQYSFGIFWQRGMMKVGLGVAADNEKAKTVYERNGMYVKREYVEYKKNFAASG
jgi:mycothiol synthase